MWSGPSGPWNQWPIHASMYQNVPHEQVDWAQLAKQWIQMQHTHPGAELPPQAQHLMASMPPKLSAPPPMQQQQAPQVPMTPALPAGPPPHKPPPPAPMGGLGSSAVGGSTVPAGYWGNSSTPSSTWMVGDSKPWAAAGAATVAPPVPVNTHPPPPPAMVPTVVPQPPLLGVGVSEKETFDYGHVSSSQPLASQSYDYNHGGGADQYGPYGHMDLPPPSYGGPDQGPYHQYWGMGSNACPPPFLRKDRRELREQVHMPFLEEEAPQLDAAKRKSLPAWIREGLEKMEREKLRRLERERAETEHRERLSKKAQQESDPLKSKFDSDSDDEKEEGLDMFSDGQRGRQSSPKRNGLQVARDASPDEEPIKPRTEEFRFRTPEERQQELMLKVRRTLTELLLEVTNEEVLSLAKEVLQKAIQKAPARQLRSSSALANIASGLGGLRGYGSDSESSSEGGSGDEDSDAELERAIHEKREAFFEWERRLTAELDEADRLDRERQRQEQRLGGADQVTEDGGARSTAQADKNSAGDLERDSSPGASSPEGSDRRDRERTEAAAMAAERLEDTSSSTPENGESEGGERSSTSRKDKEVAEHESKSSSRRGSKSSSKQDDETRKSGSSRSSSRRSPKRRSRSRSREKKGKKRDRQSSSSRSRSRSRSESRRHSKRRSRSRDRKEKSRKHRRRSASGSESSGSGSRRHRRSRSRSHKRSSRRKSRSRSHSRRRRRHSSESQGSGKRSSRKNRDR